MSITKPNPTHSDKREQEIGLILALLKSKVEDLTQEINVSKQIHDGGNKVRTSLTLDIEKAIENPVAPLIDLRGKIDNTIVGLVDTVFKSLFERNKSLIYEAYKSRCANNRLLYFIVLNDDTNENREAAFQMLDYYDNIEFSSMFPADFQFVPKEFSAKITNAEKLAF